MGQEPLAVTGPGFDRKGKTGHLVSLVDIPPTLVDACGIDIPDSMMGRSFFPANCKDVPPNENSVFFQISEETCSRGIRTARWKYSVTNSEANPFTMDSAHSYTESNLYDLEADPYELTNLVSFPQYRPVLDILQIKLLDWMERVEGMRPEIKIASGEKTDNENPQLWGIGQRKAPEESWNV